MNSSGNAPKYYRINGDAEVDAIRDEIFSKLKVRG
jgi:hypothetical protein